MIFNRLSRITSKAQYLAIDTGLLFCDFDNGTHQQGLPKL